MQLTIGVLHRIITANKEVKKILGDYQVSGPAFIAKLREVANNTSTEALDLRQALTQLALAVREIEGVDLLQKQEY